jgi:hypothetical protein
MKIFYEDLIMENGELVRIECPTEYEDDFYESIENSMKRKDWWSPEQFDGCNAVYMGLNLTRINMGKVIGFL